MKNLFIRFGRIPHSERSTIGLDDEFKADVGLASSATEAGVSVYYTYPRADGKGYNLVYPDPDKARYDVGGGYLGWMMQAFQKAIAHGEVYLVTGTKHGHGSDGEPVIRNIQIIKKLTPDEIYLGSYNFVSKPDPDEFESPEEYQKELQNWQQLARSTNTPLSQNLAKKDYGRTIRKEYDYLLNSDKLIEDELTDAVEDGLLHKLGLLTVDDEDSGVELIKQIQRIRKPYFDYQTRTTYPKFEPGSKEYNEAKKLRDKIWAKLKLHRIKTVGKNRVSPIRLENKKLNLCDLLFEEKSLEKELFGSNYVHKLRQYAEILEDGLPKYGVNFSEYNKWGINPKSKYYPIGVYFYYLSPSAYGSGAEGGGFATDRTWANIAELNLDKLVILNFGGSKNFNQEQIDKALNKLKAKYNISPEQVEVEIPTKEPSSNIFPEFTKLANIIYGMESMGFGRFNKLLHDAGYDGILDISGGYLPIEDFQGVITWPGGAKHIESIKTPYANKRPTPRPTQRLESIFKRFRSIKNGSLNLSDSEFSSLLLSFKNGMIKDFGEIKTDAFKDFLNDLFRKMDLSNINIYGISQTAFYIEEYGEMMFDAFEANPTTPKEFWKKLRNSRYEDVKLAAIDHLKESKNAIV